MSLLTKNTEAAFLEKDRAFLRERLGQYLARGNQIPDDLEQDPDRFVDWFMQFSPDPNPFERFTSFVRPGGDNGWHPDYATFLFANMLNFLRLDKAQRKFLCDADARGVKWHGGYLGLVEDELARQEKFGHG